VGCCRRPPRSDFGITARFLLRYLPRSCLTYGLLLSERGEQVMRSIIRALLSIGLLLPATLPGKAAEAVTLRLKWLNQAQFAGYYVAKDKGYYAAAGLDVSIQPGGSDFPAVQMVAGGSEQFGVTGADQILIARSKGVPVVAIAVIYRENPFVLFALKKSGITKPAEFSGHNIGLKIGGSEELIYRSVLKSAKVDKASLHEVPVKFDLSPLLTGQVDIWPGYVINEVIAAEEKGFDVSVIKPSDYGVRMYADTLFTTERMLKEQPELVKKFVAATIHGWTDALADPQGAARTTVKFGNKLEFEHELAMMKASIPLITAGSGPIGASRPADWEAIQTMLVDAGFQKTTVDISRAFTNEALPE
jgi:NitT/TauT family transport system substrate-binding protein